MTNIFKKSACFRTSFLVSVLLLLYSCQVYTPYAYNPILTRKKGEVNISAGALLSTSTIGVNASSTGALTNRMALQGNISTTSSQLRKLNLNLSYYLNPVKKYNTRILLGYSNSKLDYYTSILVPDADYISWSGNLKIPYTGLQITNDGKEITTGFALKTGVIFPTLQKTIDREAETINNDISQSNLLIEPSIFTSKRFLFNAALTKTFILPLPNNSESNQVEFPFMKFPMVNFGLSYDLVRHKNNGTKK